MEDCCLAVRKIADEFGISIGSADSILNDDLGMHRVVAKYVPKRLGKDNWNKDNSVLRSQRSLVTMGVQVHPGN